MRLRAFLKHLFRDRDPLSPLGFDIRVNAEHDQLHDPVQLVMLNDEKTPMAFVVKVLKTYLRQDKNTAIETMLKVHTEGEYPVAILDRAEAKKLIAKIENESRKRGFPLVCETRPL